MKMMIGVALPPDATPPGFPQGSYAAAANLAGWDRHAIERAAPAQAPQWR